jgi:hypothetical protein
MTARPFGVLRLLFPFSGSAQPDSALMTAKGHPPPPYNGPHFLSAQDSVEFVQFKERCAGAGDTSEVALFMDDHRLVWQEQHYGSFWLITRGSGQSLKDFVATEPATRIPYGSPPALYGRRCTTVVHDPRMGMIQRDVWYFKTP